MSMDEPHLASSAAVIHIKDKITGWGAHAKPIPPPAFGKMTGPVICRPAPDWESTTALYLVTCRFLNTHSSLNRQKKKKRKEEMTIHNGAQFHIEIVFSSLWDKFCNLQVSQSEGQVFSCRYMQAWGDDVAFGGLEHLQEAIRRVMGFLGNDLVTSGYFVAEDCFWAFIQLVSFLH